MKFAFFLALFVVAAHAALPTAATTKVLKDRSVQKTPVVFKTRTNMMSVIHNLLKSKKTVQDPSAGGSIADAEGQICAFGDMAQSGDGAASGCSALAPMCMSDASNQCVPDPNYHCAYPKLKKYMKTKVSNVISACTGPTCTPGCKKALLELTGFFAAVQNELQNAGQDTTTNMTDVAPDAKTSANGDLPLFLKSMQGRFRALKKTQNKYDKGDNKEMEDLVCFLEVAQETNLDQVSGEFATKYNATTCKITTEEASKATSEQAKKLSDVRQSQESEGSATPATDSNPQQQEAPTDSPQQQEAPTDSPQQQEPPTDSTDTSGKKSGAVKITDQQQEDHDHSTTTHKKTVEVQPDLVQKAAKAQESIKENKKKILAVTTTNTASKKVVAKKVVAKKVVAKKVVAKKVVAKKVEAKKVVAKKVVATKAAPASSAGAAPAASSSATPAAASSSAGATPPAATVAPVTAPASKKVVEKPYPKETHKETHKKNSASGVAPAVSLILLSVTALFTY